MGQKGCLVRPRGVKRRLGRSPARWTYELVKIPRAHWMQAATDRSKWKSIGEAYDYDDLATVLSDASTFIARCRFSGYFIVRCFLARWF